MSLLTKVPPILFRDFRFSEQLLDLFFLFVFVNYSMGFWFVYTMSRVPQHHRSVCYLLLSPVLSFQTLPVYYHVMCHCRTTKDAHCTERKCAVAFNKQEVSEERERQRERQDRRQ